MKTKWIITSILILLMIIISIQYKDDIKSKLIDYYIDKELKEMTFNNIEEKIEYKIKLLNKINKIQENGTFKFNTNKVVFYIPHQDDETLFFSAVIENAIKELGKENVYMVLISNGEHAKYIKQAYKHIDKYSKNIGKYDKDPEIRDQIRKKIFSESRTEEFKEAANALGISHKNLEVIGYRDGDLPNYIFEIKQAIEDFNERFEGDVTNITYSPFLDSHEDHKTIGRALLDLYIERKVDNAYFVVKDFFADKIPKNVFLESIVSDKESIENVKKAYKAYTVFDINRGRFAIGYGSAVNLFENLNSQIELGKIKVYMHNPTLLIDKLSKEDGIIDWKNILINNKN